MTSPSSISRIGAYFRRHGLAATSKRLIQAVNRSLHGDWFFLFGCDLRSLNFPEETGFEAFEIKRVNSEQSLDRNFAEQMFVLWNPEIARKRLKERFANGAHFWTITSAGALAAYGWTMVGRTIEPHFYPLLQNDVHLFDFFVAPQFRGRRLNIFLMNHILTTLAREGNGRAFIEAAQWNKPQLKSLARTQFELVARARKSVVFGKTIVAFDFNGCEP
jgi:GNAT superfamily N-acetyltransferase